MPRSWWHQIEMVQVYGEDEYPREDKKTAAKRTKDTMLKTENGEASWLELPNIFVIAPQHVFHRSPAFSSSLHLILVITSQHFGCRRLKMTDRRGSRLERDHYQREIAKADGGSPQGIPAGKKNPSPSCAAGSPLLVAAS